MFKRLSLDSNADVFAIAALIISLTVFVFFLIRAFRLKKKHVEHMSQLPLDSDSTNPRKP